jgi:hypothetical protein
VRNVRDQLRLDRLEAAANSAGEGWAVEEMGSLRAERRPIQGGWPGTLGEARGRSRRCVAEAFATDGAGPTADEIESAARVLYARAKRVWNAHAEREHVS